MITTHRRHRHHVPSRRARRGRLVRAASCASRRSFSRGSKRFAPPATCRRWAPPWLPPMAVVARGVSGVRKQGDADAGPGERSVAHRLDHEVVHVDALRASGRGGKDPLRSASGRGPARGRGDPLRAGDVRAACSATAPDWRRIPSMASLVKGRTSKDPLIEQRRQLVAEILASPPVHEKGTAFLYSNAGYVVAGAALERLTGTPWEELVREQVLAPLGLRSAGFGAPGTASAVDQPYGHLNPIGATRPPHPMPPGPLADNPLFLGPAGTLHLSIDDLAAYLREHMNGESGAGTLLSAESYRRLHRAVGDRYALGWVDDRPEWAGQRAAGLAQRLQHHVVRDDRLLSRARPRHRRGEQRRSRQRGGRDASLPAAGAGVDGKERGRPPSAKRCRYRFGFVAPLLALGRRARRSACRAPSSR